MNNVRSSAVHNVYLPTYVDYVLTPNGLTLWMVNAIAGGLKMRNLILREFVPTVMLMDVPHVLLDLLIAAINA